jgi:hypothetical protein
LVPRRVGSTCRLSPVPQACTRRQQGRCRGARVQALQALVERLPSPSTGNDAMQFCGTISA